MAQPLPTTYTGLSTLVPSSKLPDYRPDDPDTWQVVVDALGTPQPPPEGEHTWDCPADFFTALAAAAYKAGIGAVGASSACAVDQALEEFSKFELHANHWAECVALPPAHAFQDPTLAGRLNDELDAVAGAVRARVKDNLTQCVVSAAETLAAGEGSGINLGLYGTESPGGPGPAYRAAGGEGAGTSPYQRHPGESDAAYQRRMATWGRIATMPVRPYVATARTRRKGSASTWPAGKG